MPCAFADYEAFMIDITMLSTEGKVSTAVILSDCADLAAEFNSIDILVHKMKY